MEKAEFALLELPQAKQPIELAGLPVADIDPLETAALRLGS